MEVSDSMQRHILDIILRAALYQAQIIIGQAEVSSRSRRRPLQGYSVADEFAERRVCPGGNDALFFLINYIKKYSDAFLLGMENSNSARYLIYVVSHLCRFL